MLDPEAVQFNFSDAELELMQDRKPEWQAAPKKQRRQIAAEVYDDMKKTNPQWEKEERKLKKRGIHWWFHCFGRKRGSRERFDAVKKWTSRMVLGVEYENELHRRITASTKGHLSDAKEYFSSYQRELTKLINSIPTEEVTQAKETAMLWNNVGPPREQQLKNAEKHGYKYIRSFCKQMKKSCGMDCIVLSFYQEKDGKTVSVQYHEYMQEFGGKSFFSNNPNWREGDIVEKLERHALSMYDDAQGTTTKVGTLTRKPYVDVEIDAIGHPILPAPEDWPSKTSDRKDLVRAFVTAAYRRATGNMSSITPWSSIQIDQENFIHPEYLPDDFCLREPSKLKEEELARLLNFWHARQSRHSLVFRFHAYQTKSDGEFHPSREGELLRSEKKGRKRGRTLGSDSDSEVDEQPKKKTKVSKKGSSNKGKGTRKRSLSLVSKAGDSEPELPLNTGDRKRLRTAAKLSRNKGLTEMPKDSDGESFDWGDESDSDDVVEPPTKVGPPKRKATQSTEVDNVRPPRNSSPWNQAAQSLKAGPPKVKPVNHTKFNASRPTQTFSDDQPEASMKTGPPGRKNVMPNESARLRPPISGSPDSQLESSASQEKIDIPGGLKLPQYHAPRSKSCSRPEVSRHHVSQPEVSMKIGPPKKRPTRHPRSETPIPSALASLPESPPPQPMGEVLKASDPVQDPDVQSIHQANLSIVVSDQAKPIKIGPPRGKRPNGAVTSTSPQPGLGHPPKVSRTEHPSQVTCEPKTEPSKSKDEPPVKAQPPRKCKDNHKAVSTPAKRRQIGKVEVVLSSRSISRENEPKAKMVASKSRDHKLTSTQPSTDASKLAGPPSRPKPKPRKKT